MDVKTFDSGERAGWRRWRGLGVLSVAALLLHAAALGGIEWGWPVPPALPAATLRLELVETPRAVPASVVDAVAELEAGPAIEPTAPPPPRARVAAVRARLASALAAAAVELPPPMPAPTLQLALAEAATAASPAAADDAVPHYRTRMPPATTLRYELRHGVLRGTGELVWKPQGDHYELTLEGRVSGLKVLTQASAGGFDAAGVAPLRFTDQRLRRSGMAANFQREAGKVTFSGPSTEFALRAGAQDRLSWMVQLAAIVAAEPQLAVPGAKVVMWVVGAHGDAGVWAFRCVGPESVETGAGTVEAVKFMREPREPYDTTVQVWLDPQRHDLPVRAVQKSGPNDEGFELRLQQVLAAVN